MTMPTKNESPINVKRWFREHAESLWPAGLGSLSLRRCPCVRAHCEACLAGEQHLSHVLYGRIKGRRFAIYIPKDLVPDVRQCLDNGRSLQELLYQGAFRYTKALKQERAKRRKVMK